MHRRNLLGLGSIAIIAAAMTGPHVGGIDIPRAATGVNKPGKRKSSGKRRDPSAKNGKRGGRRRGR